MLNIDGGVHVAVMRDTARTAPESVAKLQVITNQTTRRTALARRKEAVNDDQLFPVPVSFIGQQAAKATMGSIGKRTTQFGFRKSTNVQIFDGYDLEAIDQAPALLVQKGGTLVSNLAVHLRQSCACSSTLPTGLLFPGQVAIGASQHAFLASSKPWVGHAFTSAEDRDVFQSRVNTNSRFRGWHRQGPIRQCNVGDQGDKPVSGRITLERRRLRLTVNRAVLPESHTANLRKIHLASLDDDPLWNAKPCLIALLGLEAREAGTVFKEVREGLLQVAQRLLECLAIHFPQPGGFWLAFQLGQFSSQVVVAQAFSMGFVVRTLAVERPIPYKPTRTGKL